MSTPEPTPEENPPIEPIELPFRSWLWAHAGRLSGIALGLLTFFGLIFLAAIGYTPAFGLLVLLVIGVTLIFLGGRIRNA